MHTIHSGRDKRLVTDLASCGYRHRSIHDNTCAGSHMSADHTVLLQVKAASSGPSVSPAAGEFPLVFRFKV